MSEIWETGAGDGVVNQPKHRRVPTIRLSFPLCTRLLWVHLEWHVLLFYAYGTQIVWLVWCAYESISCWFNLLFHLISMTNCPTIHFQAPTYCGKSGKSGSKSSSCWSGSWSSKSSSWHSSWSRESRDGQKRKHKKHRGHHDRDLEHEEASSIYEKNVRRRRINGGKQVYVGERVP